MNLNSKRSNKVQLVALHGFWGLPKDFDFLKQDDVELYVPSLWSWSHLSLSDFSTEFLKHLRATTDPDSAKLLIGYSMGARLGLHLLEQDKDFFSAAILLSANPGLMDVEQKISRLNSDLLWAEKFEHLPWPDLCALWSSQEVLKGAVFDRPETDFDRHLLALAMKNWSLGHQKDFRDFLAQAQIPIKWVVGEKDLKFFNLAKELKPSALLEVITLKDAGHRLILESPQEVCGIVERSIKQLLKPH